MPAKPETDQPLSTFAANLAAVIQHSQLSVNAWSIKHKLVQTTVNRIVTGKSDATTGQVEEIAKRVGMSAWQLLVPNLDPQSPPVIREASATERDLYQRLKQTIEQLEEMREAGNTMPGDFDALGGTRVTEERVQNQNTGKERSK